MAAAHAAVGGMASPAGALPTAGIGVHAATVDDALIAQARARADYAHGRTRVVTGFLTPQGECDKIKRDATDAVDAAVKKAAAAKDPASAARADADAARAAVPPYACFVRVLPAMINTPGIATKFANYLKEVLPRARKAETEAQAAADAADAAAESPADVELANDAAAAEDAAALATVRVRESDASEPTKIKKIDQ
ncbi:hypothetical protein AWN90_37185 [Nocardia terpenica]|uniref:Uncharacterized protein n=1 Tax=Nocardia terpenica TaxID=455432 RepID=A0A164L062_9NOCA|nr:hypothetical protein AWN90_37185 [Nocardia terpenica]